MTKTLADMSAEERAECVGMWADTTGQGLGVVVNATEPSDCWVLFPEGGGRVATCHNQRVTPRFDLPRAWTPDGEPEFAQVLAEEEWQYGVTYIGVKHGGHHIDWVESTGDAEFDKETLQLLVKRWKREGQSPKIVRRRVSPPEVIDEEL